MTFPFQRLPREIRDKIYKHAVCAIEPAPTQDNKGQFAETPTTHTFIKHSIEPQILRVSRQIHDEAIYLMTKTNLFVKVTTNVTLTRPLFAAKRIPILNITKKNFKFFRGHVMHHTFLNQDEEPSWEFIVLHRDLGGLCIELDIMKTMINQQTIALEDPFPKLYRQNFSEGTPSDGTMPQSSFSRKLQEHLLSPYHQYLKGSGIKFKIQGKVSPDLVKSLREEIETVPTKDCETVLGEFIQLKLDGNEHFRVEDGRRAGETWSEAIVKMRMLMDSPSGEDLRQMGGVAFINKLADLCWVLHSNMAQASMKAIRDNQDDRSIVNGMINVLLHAVDEAMSLQEYFEDMGGSWEPTPAQMSKLFYRGTVGCRIVGSTKSLESGVRFITKAMRLTPGDATLEAEASLILRAR